MPGPKMSEERFSCVDPTLGALLPAFVDGELEADQHTRFAAHLKHCARCSEDLLLRRSISSLLRQSWPALSEDPGGGWARVLAGLRTWRVPVWVPAGIAVATLVVLVLLRPPPQTREWTVVSDSVAYFVPVRSRGGGVEEVLRCSVRPGQQLELTLAAVPATGMPVHLVIEGAAGSAAEPGLPFRLVEGFPVLTVKVPELEAGEYPASIVSGQARQTVDHLVLVVSAEHDAE